MYGTLLSAGEELALAMRLEKAREDFYQITSLVTTKVLLTDAEERQKLVQDTVEQISARYKREKRGQKARDQYQQRVQHLRELEHAGALYRAADCEEASSWFFSAWHHLQESYTPAEAISFLEAYSHQEQRTKSSKALLAPFQQAQQSYLRERNALVEANLRLVPFIAKTFRNIQSSSLEFADLLAEGNLGLLRATETYDYQRGFRFTTYASKCVWMYISRVIGEQGKALQIPLNVQWTKRKIDRAAGQLEQKLGRALCEEDDTEIASLLGMSLESLATVRKLPKQPLSLDAVYEMGEGTGDPLIQRTRERTMMGDLPESLEEAEEKRSFREKIIATADELVAHGRVKPRDHDIFLEYYFDPDQPSMDTLGRTFG